MKESQPMSIGKGTIFKYIKESNERFSTELRQQMDLC